MKKRHLLLMAAAFLFSWAGFAQDEEPTWVLGADGDLLGAKTGLNQDWDGGTYQTNADGSVTYTFTQNYGGVGWGFDEEADDVRTLGFTGYEIVLEVGSAIPQVLAQFNNYTVKPGGEDFCPKNTYTIRGFFNAGALEQYPVSCLIMQNAWCTNEQGIYTMTILSAKLIKEDPPVPDYFTTKIDFEDCDLGYKVEKLFHSATPITHMYSWGYGKDATDKEPDHPDGYPNELTIVADPIQKHCLEVKGDYNLATFFKVSLEGKTFGQVEKINFKLKFKESSNEGEEAGADVYKPVYVVVNNADVELNGNQEEFALCPAVFMSFNDKALGKFGGEWTSYTFQTDWFTDNEINSRLSIGGYEVDWNNIYAFEQIQLGIGLNMNTPYYIDDIELVFCQGEDCGHHYVTVIESVAVAPSVKVYSIPGGLVIEGAEKARVYGIDGSLIATATGKIALPKGVYIVAADNQVVKAIVK